MDKIVLNNRILSLSESDDGLTLNAKFLICPLDESNLNGVGLKESDLTSDEKEGLKNQPIVAKIVKNSDGELDFSGHNLKKIYEVNEETNKLETKYIFDTYPIGVHTKSYVEELEVDGILKKCIVADCLFWTRYENSIKILKRLYDKQNLHSSWEISYGESYQENGVKWLKQILWLGNCILGSNVDPAYPLAGALEISSLSNEEKEFIEAFTQDVIKEQLNNQTIASSTDNNDEEDNKINNNVQGGITDMSEKVKEIIKDVASLTDSDIYTKVRRAINATDNEKWYYVSMLYPYEFRAVAYTWDREKDEDFIEFSYSVNSDETVSITGQKEVKMVFVAKETMETQIAEKDTKISELETTISEKDIEIEKLGTEVSEKNDVMVKVSEKVTELETKVAELEPLKAEKEESERLAKEKETSEKIESLKVLACKSGHIAKEELETSEELKKMIEELDEKSIKAEIAERFMKKLEQSEKENQEKELEASTKNKTKVNPKSDITSDEGIAVSAVAYVMNILKSTK